MSLIAINPPPAKLGPTIEVHDYYGGYTLEPNPKEPSGVAISAHAALDFFLAHSHRYGGTIAFSVVEDDAVEA